MSGPSKQAAKAASPAIRPDDARRFSGTSGTLEDLFEIAIDDLEDYDLERLSHLAELGNEKTRRLSEMLERLACLVMNDEHVGIAKSNNAMADFFASFSDMADQAHGLVKVGLVAKWELERRIARNGGAE